MREARDLLDAICRAAGLTLSGMQQSRAQSATEIALDELRGEWLHELRRAGDHA